MAWEGHGRLAPRHAPRPAAAGLRLLAGATATAWLAGRGIDWCATASLDFLGRLLEVHVLAPDDQHLRVLGLLLRGQRRRVPRPRTRPLMPGDYLVTQPEGSPSV